MRITATEATSVAWTTIAPRTRGTTWRTMIAPWPSPLTRAASMYRSSRTVRVTERITRVTGAESIRPSGSIAGYRLLGKTETTTISTTSRGIVISTSAHTEITRSAAPRR